jgi:hypothetical protein
MIGLVAQHSLSLGAGRRLIWTSGGHAWLWLLAGVAALVLVLLLYRYERRLVSPAAGRLLLVLRLLAAMALAAALFEPVTERRFTENVRGRVVLGVDLSESMQTIDSNRTGSERQSLARALGLEEGESIDGLPRSMIVRRLLEGDWLAKLARTADIDAVGFAERPIVDISPSALAASLSAADAASRSGTQRTDWRPVLERALQQPADVPILGVVLLTDGRQNVASNTEGDTLADRLAARGIAVSSILIGSTQPPRDAAIASVRVPERVVKDDEADVDVTVKIDGEVPGTELPVVLEREGAAPLRKTVKVPADGTRPSVAFRVPLDRAGMQSMTVTIGPMPGDARRDNDQRGVVIEVADDTTRALLVESEPRWEFRYLRNALGRDPRVNVEAVVFQQPPPADSAAPTYTTSLPDLPADGPDPLNSFDLIVVGDVAPDDAPASFWTRLEAFVDRRGGTLVLCAAPRSYAGWLRDETAGRLLPVVDPSLVPVDTDAIDPSRPSLPAGVTLVPAAEARDEAWPMIRFDAEPVRSLAVWESLPRLPWALASSLKPAATSLVRASDERLDATRASVISAMPYGLGQVFWVGTDSTWRWRYRAGDAYHHRFWGQVVRWAGAGRLTAGNALVKFGPARPRAAEGQGFPIRARFAEESSVGPETLAAARIFRAKPLAAAREGEPSGPVPEGEAVAVVALRPSPVQPRMFEGLAPGLPAGLYAVTLDVPGMPGIPRDAAALEISTGASTERIELAAARETLERLAELTGGEVHEAGDAFSLVERLESRNTPSFRIETSPVWDRPIALLTFFGILTAEWALRKRVGLP